MSPDDPRRLKPGQSVLTFVAPAPPAGHDGDHAGDDPASPRQPAGATSDERTAYAWYKHFDYGLLRDGGDGYDYEAWIVPSDASVSAGKPGLWHTVTGVELLNASPIGEDVARALIGDGNLYGPNENAEYERRSKANRRA